LIRAVQASKGFSLLEVMIGLIFLAIGLLAIASMHVTSLRGGFVSGNLMQATYIAQDRLERLKNVSFTNAALSNGSHSEGTARVPDAPEGMIFNRSYNVTTVIDPNGNYLRINYSVTWNDGTPHGISFTTIRSQ
jgi:type IV pilus assembly protein PilV